MLHEFIGKAKEEWPTPKGIKVKKKLLTVHVTMMVCIMQSKHTKTHNFPFLQMNIQMFVSRPT